MSAGQELLADPGFQADQAYRRWHQGRKSWSFASERDWQRTLEPFADRWPQYGVGGLMPLQLIGECEVYSTPDGASPLRDQYVFAVGGSQESSGGASVYLGRWKGLFKKAINDNILFPIGNSAIFEGLAFEGFHPEVQSEVGNTHVAVQFARGGLPVLRIGWWGRDRERTALINNAQLFCDALKQ